MGRMDSTQKMLAATSCEQREMLLATMDEKERTHQDEDMLAVMDEREEMHQTDSIFSASHDAWHFGDRNDLYLRQQRERELQELASLRLEVARLNRFTELTVRFGEGSTANIRKV